jgi:hypothetical protein
MVIIYYILGITKKLNEDNFINPELYLLCKINDNTQNLLIRFIPCESFSKSVIKNSTGVGDKYTFITNNENLKQNSEDIAQSSIHDLIQEYYKSWNYDSLNDKGKGNKNNHDLGKYKPPTNIDLNPDCNEKNKKQCAPFKKKNNNTPISN